MKKVKIHYDYFGKVRELYWYERILAFFKII